MGVRMPAEWAEQDWIWIGFPHDASLWLDDLVPAQEQIAAFANVVAESGQQVRLVVRDAANEMRARELVNGAVV
jgi:agmatine deiminase